LLDSLLQEINIALSMATLDDKLLGEKLHYYCSSSEDEGPDDDSDHGADNRGGAQPRAPPPPPPMEAGGGTANTGPKGVMKDWQRFKQLETEKREEAELEKMALAKKLSLTCRSEREDKEAKKKEDELDAEFEALMEDGFLETYMQKRMEELMQKTQNIKKFGKLVEIPNGDSFLHHVDGEDKNVTVIILLYELGVESCDTMKGCLSCLASEYLSVKFCSILSSSAGLSKHFKVSGVPALLVYKAGQLCGSFVRLTDQLGEDFYSNDVEQFLVEHGMLPDKEAQPSIIRGTQPTDSDDD